MILSLKHLHNQPDMYSSKTTCIYIWVWMLCGTQDKRQSLSSSKRLFYRSSHDVFCTRGCILLGPSLTSTTKTLMTSGTHHELRHGPTRLPVPPSIRVERFPGIFPTRPPPTKYRGNTKPWHHQVTTARILLLKAAWALRKRQPILLPIQTLRSCMGQKQDCMIHMIRMYFHCALPCGERGIAWLIKFCGQIGPESSER